MCCVSKKKNNKKSQRDAQKEETNEMSNVKTIFYRRFLNYLLGFPEISNAKLKHCQPEDTKQKNEHLSRLSTRRTEPETKKIQILKSSTRNKTKAKT